MSTNPPTQEQLDKIPDIEHQSAWETFCLNNPPLCSTMTSIKEQNLRILIEHLLTFLTERSLSNPNMSLNTTESWLSQWIYATLSFLHTPLEPYTHSILRDIAKVCIQLRNGLEVDDLNSALPLNLLICIISNNFNQLDLCD
jgi:gem associated protein 2